MHLQGEWYSGLHEQKCFKPLEGGDPSPLLSPDEAAPGMLGLVLGSPSTRET